MSKQNITNKATSLSVKDKIYCAIEGSTCDKNLNFHSHSPCCLKCEHKCKACTVKDITQCTELCSKEDIIQYKIEDLREEEDKHIQALNKIKEEIFTLSKELE